MPLFSDLSNLSLYYGGTSNPYINVNSYSTHSSLVTSPTYRSPLPSTYSRYTGNRCYTPHLATIGEGSALASQRPLPTSKVSRINSPKSRLITHTSPKYKIIKPISINTDDIDVSRNRYQHRKLERNNEFKSSPTSPVSPSPSAQEKSTVCTTRSKDSKELTKLDEKVSNNDSDGTFMPRIDHNNRSTIRRGRTVVRLHTKHLKENPDICEEDPNNNVKDVIDKGAPQIKKWRSNFESDELNNSIGKEESELSQSPTKRWRSNFQPDELKLEKRYKKTTGERLVEKFLIRDKDAEEQSRIKLEEKRRIREENLNTFTNEKRRSIKTRPNIAKKTPSFHQICKSISSDKVDEDLNPGRVSRRTSQASFKEIRRNSAEILQEHVKMLDDILKEEKIVSDVDVSVQNSHDSGRGSFKRKKKPYTRKKSSHELPTVPSETQSLLQRRLTIKNLRRTSSENLEENLDVVNNKKSQEKRKPIITGSVEVQNAQQNLKFKVDDVHVESTPTPTKKKII